MNKIIVNQGSFKLEEIDLTHGTITIGRAADNDIRLDDSAVSSHHVKVVTLFDVSFIQDMDSTNGTLVNGKNVKKHTLHAGDVISLGKHQLLFQSETAASKAESNHTMIINRNDMQNMLTDFMDNKPAAPRAFNSIDSKQTNSAASNPPSATNQANPTQASRARTPQDDDVVTAEKKSSDKIRPAVHTPEKNPNLGLTPTPGSANFIPKGTQKIFDSEQTQQFQEGDLIRKPVPAITPKPNITRGTAPLVTPTGDQRTGRNSTHQTAPRQKVSDATMLKMIIQNEGGYSRKGTGIFGSMQIVLGILLIAIIAAISYTALV